MQIHAELKYLAHGVGLKTDWTMATNAKATRFQLQKDRLLRAAAQCFNEKGFSGTSLRDVADGLGLTDAALYYYVRNKEELVYLCYIRAVDLGREALDKALTNNDDGIETVRTYLRNHIEMMVGERGPIAIMSEIPSLRPNHRNEILEFSRAHSKRFEELLQAGIADGSIESIDVRMTSNAIMGSVNWIPKWFHGDRELALRLLQEFPQILTRGLATENQGRAYKARSV